MNRSLVSLADALSSAEVFIDGDWVESKDQDPDGRVRLVQLADVGDGAYLNKSARFLTETKARQLRCTFICPGDVLVARMPDPLGRACIFPGDDLASVTVVDVCIIRPNPNCQDARWLMHSINSSPCRKQIAAFTSGTTRSRISRSNLAKVKIPDVTLPEQRRIADMLDRAEALRAKRRAALAEIESLIQSLFMELFTCEESAEWPRVGLQDAYWFQEGPGVRKWQFRTSGTKLLNVGNIEKGGVLNLGKTDRYLDVAEATGKYKHFLVDAGDLVIASSGISFDTDGLLRTRGAFVSEQDLPLCMNTSTIRFKAITGLSDLRYVWAWLDSREFRSQITKAVTGSAQQNFGPSHLASLMITLPPLSVQRTFADHLHAVETLRASELSSLEDMDVLFSSLQQRAFRGEL